jgi:hypothetical protein
MIFLQRTPKPAQWSAEVGGALLSSSDAQPYGFIVLRGRELATPPAHAELVPASPIVELWPQDAYFDGALKIELPITTHLQTAERLLVYRKNRDTWDPYSRAGDGSVPGAMTNRLGTFAIMDDAVPPKIRVREPLAGATLGSQRPVLKAEITDGGSGVDTFDATLNGHWLLMEYDPEQDLLRWEQDEDLPPGPATLVIDVTDRAGNAAQQRVDFVVPN